MSTTTPPVSDSSQYDSTPPHLGGSGRPTPRGLTPPQFQRAVSSNVRRHVIRAAVRVAVLLVADLAAVGLGRLGLIAIRILSGANGRVSQVIDGLFPIGYLRSQQFAFALIIGLAVAGNYGPGDRRRDSQRVLMGVSLAVGLQLWGSTRTVPFAVILTEYVATVLALGLIVAVFRRVLDQGVRLVHVRQGVSVARAILVGQQQDCDRMACAEAFADGRGMTVVQVIATDNFSVSGRGPTIHPVHELEYFIHASKAETVIICGFPGASVILRVVKASLAAECQVLSWNPNFDLLGAQPGLTWKDGQPFIEWHAPALRWGQRLAKRLMDISLAAAGLIFLSPLMATTAIAVRVTSPGPAVFGHLRLGRFGRAFKCLKFRSMYSDAEIRLRADPHLYAEYVRNDFKLPADKDKRITPLGRLLRKTSIDELPQLWNVLRGDMSLVGPRPIVPDELQFYEADGSLLFLSLRPGITGAWQVKGRSAVAYPERARMEVTYVQNWSLAYDVELLLRTLPAVLRQRGAH